MMSRPAGRKMNADEAYPSAEATCDELHGGVNHWHRPAVSMRAMVSRAAGERVFHSWIAKPTRTWWSIMGAAAAVGVGPRRHRRDAAVAVKNTCLARYLARSLPSTVYTYLVVTSKTRSRNTGLGRTIMKTNTLGASPGSPCTGASTHLLSGTVP